MIKKKDKEKAKKEIGAKERILEAIRKREDKAFHKTSVTIHRCKRLRKEVLKNSNILIDDHSIAAFLEVIINPKVEVILAIA
jgi:hypothetical protein